MIAFFFGVVAGSILTILCFGLCVIASESEEREKELFEKWKEDK